MPKLSVVVCTYNRVKYLLTALEHLEAQKGIRNSDYEVIVVNNNSPDDTDSQMRNFLDASRNLHCKYVIEEKQGHTYSRNRGIEEANGELIAFIDDDAYVHQDYCESVISFFDHHPNVVAIGGKINPVYEGDDPKWMSRFLLPLVAALDMGAKPKAFGRNKFPIGANMAYRKWIFDRYGLFNIALGRRGKGLEGGDEKDMIFRIKQNKELVYYAPNVCVDHIIPESRIQMDYIKGMAVGVGTSEKKRLSRLPFSETIKKVLEECIKIGGTFILGLVYYLKLQPTKANMLVRFRFWVLKGYFQ